MKPIVCISAAAAAAALLILGSSAATAQPLAEVARQESLRRAALARSGVTATEYTNADLRGGGRLTTAAGRPQAAGGQTTAPTPGAEDPGTATPDGEDQWRNRIAAVRQALERAQLTAAALQNRIDSLGADFAARDDPAQRSVIERSRQAALGELENTRVEIEDLTRQIEDIREEARRANVPPGWLR